MDSIHNCRIRPAVSSALLTWWILAPACQTVSIVTRMYLKCSSLTGQRLSVPFRVPLSCACSPFTGNPSSRLVPVTNCFQAVSNARRLGGALVHPPPDPLRGPPLLPTAYGSRLGFPRFPLEVTVPTRFRLPPSFLGGCFCCLSA